MKNQKTTPTIHANFTVKRRPNRRKLDLASAAVKVAAVLLAIVASVALAILITQGSSDPFEVTVKLYLVFGLALALWSFE